MSNSFLSLVTGAFLSPRKTFQNLSIERDARALGAVLLVRLSLNLVEAASLLNRLDPALRGAWAPVLAFGLFAGLVLTSMVVSWAAVLAGARVLGLKGGGRQLMGSFGLASLVSGPYSLIRAALLLLQPPFRIPSLVPLDLALALLDQLNSPVFVALSLLGRLFGLWVFLLVSISFSAIYGVSWRRALGVVLLGYLALLLLFPVGNF